MANYPAPTNFRMAYDADGTQVFIKPTGSGSSSSQLTGTQVSSLNGEVANNLVTLSAAGDITPGTAAQIVYLFPQRRDFLGLFIQVLFSNGAVTSRTFAVDTSADTTNGIDGTWTNNVISESTPSSTPIPYYRTDVRGASAPNVAAVRIRIKEPSSGTVIPCPIHLYGSFTTPSFDRLAIWHPTLNQELTYRDFQDQTRGTSATAQFRVRNMSSSLTANSVSVSTSVLTEATPTLASQITYSDDNSTFNTILNLGSIAASTTTGVLYMKNSLSSTAAISLWAGRIRAAATSFS